MYVSNEYICLCIQLRNVNLTLSSMQTLGLKYDEADLSAALMTEIFPELVYSSDMHFILPSKKALRRFPSATVLPRPLPDTLNAQYLLSDSIRRNLAEIADLAMRRIPSLIVELDRKIADNQWKTEEVKLQTRKLTAAIRQRPNMSDSEARVAIIRQALHIQNRTTSSIATRSLDNACLYSSTLKESIAAGGTLASMNANDSFNNRVSNSFNATSSKSSNNRIPGSLEIPLTTLNRRSNNENVQQISQNQTTKARFSIKLNWTRT